MSKAGIGLAVAAVAVVGALGTSYYMGSRVQHGFEEFASTLQQGNKQLRVKIISYERGLFSSTAQTEWTLASRSAQWSFKANHRISHGPMPRGHAAEIDTDFLLNDDADPGLKTALAGKAPLSAHTVVNWNQSADGTLNSPAFTAQLKNATYDWGGMTAALSMGAHSTAIKGKAEFAGLGFTDPQQKGLQIKGGTMEMDLQQAKGHDFLVGPFKVALASMTMKGPLGGASAGDEEENDGDEADGADSAQAPAPAAEIETVALEGLSFDTNTVLAGDVVNLDMKTSIKTIDIPKYKVSDVALDFAMLNFDAAWLGQVQQLSRQGEGDLKDEIRALHRMLLNVFEGNVKGIGGGVSSVSGIDLARPWAPLTERYAERKITDSFWYETGTLLDYVAKSIQQLSGPQAVRKVEVKAAPIPRGAKSLKVSVLITPARLPEPLQSLVMYPFLQGRGNDMTGMGGTDVQAVKLLVNHALRGFIPDISAELGRRMLDELRT